MLVEEARKILNERVRALRDLSYRDLLQYLDNSRTDEFITPEKQVYQIEIEAMWDDQPNSDLRVFVSIDDGSLRWAIAPLVDGFIIRPDGTFVGE